MMLGRQRSFATRLLALLALCVCFSGHALAGEALLEGQGRVIAVDVSKHRAVISGRVYQAPIDVNVSIGGSYGAFSMLQSGMRVRFEYYENDGERVLRSVTELPANQPIDES